MQQKKLIQILNKIDSKIFYFLIIIIATLFTFNYGYRGVFPLDSFLIFDAGYKVLNGIHPFKDYWSISGPLLDYLQSFFFYIFQTNWFSYVLHAAFINSLLAVLVYFFYRSLGLEKVKSFLYSSCVSILAYPSIGTPFMDHHAIIFSVIFIIFFTLGLFSNKKLFWFLSALFLSFSFLSKQIPAAYFGIITVPIIFFYWAKSKKIERKNINYFFVGIFTSLLIFLSIAFNNGIPLNNFIDQYIFYPLTIGDARTSSLNFDLNTLFFQFKFIYFSLAPLILIFFILFKKKQKKGKEEKDFLFINFLFLTFLVFIYTQILTKNQILIFFLIPFYLGISHLLINKYYKNKFLSTVIIFFLIISMTKYHLSFNENKKFMDFNEANFRLAVDARIIDERFKGLKWITPRYQSDPIYEINLINEIKNIIIKDNRQKIIISNYQILPLITNTQNFAPNKWFDPRSVPSDENKYYKTYKDFVMKNLVTQKIEVIYFIGKNKVKHFKFLAKKNCIDYRKINEIFFSADIQKCYN